MGTRPISGTKAAWSLPCSSVASGHWVRHRFSEWVTLCVTRRMTH